MILPSENSDPLTTQIKSEVKRDDKTGANAADSLTQRKAQHAAAANLKKEESPLV